MIKPNLTQVKLFLKRTRLLIGVLVLITLTLYYVINIIPAESSPNDNLIADEEVFYDYDFSNKYYYEQLSPYLKSEFCRIYDGIVNFNDTIVLNSNMSVDDLNKIIYILHFDCPELFYLSESSQNYKKEGNKALVYYPQYTYSIDTVRKMQNEIDTKTKEFTSLITSISSDESKEKFIHDYIAQNTIYNQDTDNKGNIYGCLIEGKANCKGYSSTFSYLCRLEGIECNQVIGTATSIQDNNSSIGHSWNFIKLNHKNYYVDVCWNDFDDQPSLGGIPMSYIFYNLPASSMFMSHNPTETTISLGTIPLDNDDSLIYYKQSGLYIDNINNASTILARELKKINENSSQYVIIQCSNHEIYESLQNNLMSIIKETIDNEKLSISTCKKINLETANTLILANFS